MEIYTEHGKRTLVKRPGTPHASAKAGITRDEASATEADQQVPSHAKVME